MGNMFDEVSRSPERKTTTGNMFDESAPSTQKTKNSMPNREFLKSTDDGIALNKLASNLEIPWIRYFKVGQLTPMFMRPYQAHASHSALNLLAERIDRCKSTGGNLNAANVSGISKDLIYPSSVPTPTIIDQNWVSNSRFIFIMKVDSMDRSGSTRHMYLIGYTNHAEVSYQGTLDPDMVHHINSVIETVEVVEQTSFGTVAKERLIACYNLLENAIPDLQTMVHLQRPCDVTTHLFNEDLRNVLMDGGASETISLHNTGSTIRPNSHHVFSSNFANCVPTNYISSTLNGAILGIEQRQLDISNVSPSYSFSNDSTYTQEPMVDNNTFLSVIRQRSQGWANNTFKLSLLMQLDPTIESRAELLRLHRNAHHIEAGGSTPDVGEYWSGQDRDTLTAYTFMESVMGLAAKYGITKIDFVASNMIGQRLEPQVVISQFNSFINLEDQSFLRLLEHFKQAFITTVLNDHSVNNSQPIHVRIVVDLAGTSKICLYDTGGQETWFTLPGFANSLFTPVTTLNTNTFEELATSVGDIAREVSLTQQRNAWSGLPW